MRLVPYYTYLELATAPSEMASNTLSPYFGYRVKAYRLFERSSLIDSFNAVQSSLSCCLPSKSFENALGLRPKAPINLESCAHMVSGRVTNKFCP